MIYTLTLNPALDYVVRLDNLAIGETNRIQDEHMVAGGKGINVSKLLKNLNKPSIALGFIGGFSGRELARLLKEEKINTSFINCSIGFTRINIKIKSTKETEINGKGLSPSNEEISQLYNQLSKIKDGDYLFLSGSIPKSLGDDFYFKIMKFLIKKEIKIVVDAIGNSLVNTLSLNPFLIKPNKRELEELFNTSINSIDDVENYAKKLQSMGAKNIIVSLGSEGAYLLSESGESIYNNAPKGKVIDTVGSGDSMVAAFMYAVSEGYSVSQAFKFSIAAGSATAFSKNLATKEEILKIYNEIREKK